MRGETAGLPSHSRRHLHRHRNQTMHALIDFAAIHPTHASDNAAAQATPRAGSAALHAAFGEPCEVLAAHHIDQVQTVLQAVHQRALRGQWCVGYVRYEAAAAFDGALDTYPARGPLVWFGVHDAPLPAHPDLAVPQSNAALHAAALADPTRVTWQPGIQRTAFNQALQRLHQAIADGEIYQANYTARVAGQLHVPPLQLFAAMRQAQQGGFAAYLDTGEEQILSVSPELFFDWHQGHIVTRPMKGTAPRGRTPDEDTTLAQMLQNSPKERAENVMIVDLIRNDLSRIAKPFSVTVEGLCRVQALSTVWQMVTDVHADTRSATTLFDVFAALFPCGSVTGAPKVQAMRLIRELEDGDRGVYCGAIGVVRPGGSATFNVPIRTASVHGSTVRVATGSGITHDSHSDAEWQEWRHKLAYLSRASQAFDVLETMALCDGAVRHADAHLQRMGRSAAHFGFAWKREAAQQCLAELALAHPQGLWRVRLLLGVGGEVHAQVFAMTPSCAPVRLQLAATPTPHAHSEFSLHKTTRRAHYEAFAPSDQDIFDTVLWNISGQVTECTRGNVAFLLDGRWVTPALGCGLLSGVGRAHWLAQERLQEAVIAVSDLPRIQAMAFINSLRGWLEAVWHQAPALPLAQASPNDNDSRLRPPE